MATTQNTYTGDGSTTNYSFTFEYLKQADVKVTLDTAATTAYTFANATTLSFTTAPASGVAIRIYRDTDIDTLQATFFAGSAIKAEDLNNNFTQSNFAVQEADFSVDTANTTAASAVTTANSAVTTANGAVTTANSAVTTANTASTTASSAVTTANGAVTSANTAVSTANTATTTATNAVNTANAAANAVSAAAFYSPIAALANLPSSPSNEDRVEVVNSTGVESSSAVSGVPAGFVGSTDLTIRLQYNSSTSKWAWQQYFAADPENRYLTQSLPVVKGDSTNGAGQLTLNCENNSHGVKIKGPPHSAAATYTLTLPDDAGTNGQLLSTNGSGTLSWTSTTAPVASVNGNTGTVVLAASDVGAATTAQGTKADSALQSAAIGVSIQAYDADTAKTDVAQSFSKAQRGAITTLTDGATVTPDFATSNNYTLTLGHNATIANPTNLTAGQSGSIFLVQDGTGSRTAAWGSYWDFAGGTAPTLTTTAAGVDRVDYVVRSSTSIHAVATLAYS